MGRSGPLAPALTPSPHSLGRQAAGKTSAVEKLLGAEEEGTAPFYFKRKESPELGIQGNLFSSP